MANNKSKELTVATEQTTSLAAASASAGVMALAIMSDEEFAARLDAMKRSKRRIREIQRSLMQRDVDYGVMPGTNDKLVLFKSGAEGLCNMYQLVPTYEVQRVVGDGVKEPHLTYVVTCKLHPGNESAPAAASGVGSCNTWEDKYRYRKAERLCPRCGGPFIIKGKAEYGGGWVCLKARGGCGAKFQTGDAEIERQRGGKIENADPFSLDNCVTPDTYVLTSDLRWVPAGEVKTGDHLFGVSEEAARGRPRNLRTGVATVAGRRIDDLYEIRLADGAVVRCNGEHKWLVKKKGVNGTEWVSTETMYMERTQRRGRPRKWRIIRLCSPWTSFHEAAEVASRFRTRPVPVDSIEAIGPGVIVLLGSTARTYIAEGLIAHNTILKMAKKRAYVDATLEACDASDLFTQDIVENEAEIGGQEVIDVPVKEAPIRHPQEMTMEEIATTPGARKWFFGTLHDMNLTHEQALELLSITSFKQDMPNASAGMVLEALRQKMRTSASDEAPRLAESGGLVDDLPPPGQEEEDEPPDWWKAP
jgi:hypothetical protein